MELFSETEAESLPAELENDVDELEFMEPPEVVAHPPRKIAAALRRPNAKP